MREYKNRYGDVFTFTKDENNDILWEGNFEYCRIGYPNDYTRAYNSYCEDMGNLLTLEEFKTAVHKYDDIKNEYVLNSKYTMMVDSLKDEIDMVDPSGGCYISRGMSLKFLGFEDCIVEDFKRIPTGYKIIIKKYESNT